MYAVLVVRGTVIVSPTGQTVVYTGTVSVVAWPVGQLATPGGHLVTV